MSPIAIGVIVTLAADPRRTGVVLSAQEGGDEYRYQVFMDGSVHSFYESQLRPPRDGQPAEPEFVSIEQLHIQLSALQLQHPSCSTLHSVNSARIDFIPYQFRPALKFIRADRPRLLIADGVGVGKTIEAGLILRELQARVDVQSVLIICPRPLVTERKWQQEMNRFDERFTALDGPMLRRCIADTDLDGTWPVQYAKAILPYSLLDESLLHGQAASRTRGPLKGLLQLDPPPRFDLIIVDEAHHIRNSDTFSHKAVRFLCDNAEAAVFLTATPIQLGSKDLFTLLQVLRPDLVIDWETYLAMAEPNPHINVAVSRARAGAEGWQQDALNALRRAASTPWGRAVLTHNPEFADCESILAQPTLSREERVHSIRRLEDLHTFAGLINRTRRRDIGDFTVRKPETVAIPFTAAQREIHDRLIDVQTRILAKRHDDANVRFLMSALRRQAASCLFGLTPFIRDILNRHLGELEWLESAEDDINPDDSILEQLRREIDEVTEAARRLPPEDPKFDALCGIIAEKHRMPNNRVMVFSSFRHTLAYLHRRLTGAGLRAAVIHGDVPDEERTAIRGRFEASRGEKDAIDVLLFSEVGCEGLDYQFCDCIANYDIPWNPMRIEQRIGRIDRVGQTSETVVIYNFITPDTVDAEIYERCLLRIGVFTQSLGDSEEILGAITQEIRSIAENLALTHEERTRKLDQLAENDIRRIQEQRQLEDRETEFFAIRVPRDAAREEVDEASSAWLSPQALQRLVTRYLEAVCGEDREYILGDKALKTLRLAQEARTRILHDFRGLARKATPDNRAWEKWLKGSEQHLAITFEAECAAANRHCAFLMPVHPLVLQAAQHFYGDRPICISTEVSSDSLPAGHHPFAIYAWDYVGIRRDLQIRVVCPNPDLAQTLPGLLTAAEARDSVKSMRPSNAAEVELDAAHYRLWTRARDEHRERSEVMARARRESLDTSHSARIALLREQLASSNDEKIRRMRQSQIDRAEIDYARRMEELAGAGPRADIIAKRVVIGLIDVTKGYGNEHGQ